MNATATRNVPEVPPTSPANRDYVHIGVREDICDPSKPTRAFVTFPPTSDESIGTTVDVDDPRLDPYPDLRESAIEMKRVYDANLEEKRKLRGQRRYESR